MIGAGAKARLDAWAVRQTCRHCGTPSPRVVWKLTSRPIGSFSLAGVQSKVSANEWPWLVCDGCGHESKGLPA